MHKTSLQNNKVTSRIGYVEPNRNVPYPQIQLPGKKNPGRSEVYQKRKQDELYDDESQIVLALMKLAGREAEINPARERARESRSKRQRVGSCSQAERPFAFVSADCPYPKINDVRVCTEEQRKQLVKQFCEYSEEVGRWDIREFAKWRGIDYKHFRVFGDEFELERGNC